MRPGLAMLLSLGVAMLLGDAGQAAGRNIVLIVADDLGTDLGCYGNPVIRTPHLDRLAAESTRFRQAFCTTASCSASRSVILSGLHNHANGHYGHQHSYHHFQSHETVKSLPILLGRAGYRTGRIGKFHLAPDGVFKFDEVLPGNPRSAVAMADQCKGFITTAGDKPFFLYFCLTDPHRGGGQATELPQAPDRFGNLPKGKVYPGVQEVVYDPKDVIVPRFLPDTPACRAELAQYYQSVSRLDQGVGRLLEVLKETKKLEETLIVFTSDHGSAFPGAKTTAYEPGLQIPMIVRHPQAKKRGLASSAMVSLVDLTPTLLDFAAAPPAGLHGRSFLPILEEEKPKGWEEIFASHTFHEVTMYYPMRAVRNGPHKLIWNIAHPLPFPFASDLWAAPTWQDAYKKGPETRYGQRSVMGYIQRPRFELYDLAADPDEVKNLAADAKHAPLLADLQAKLKDFQKRTGDPWLLKWEYE